MTDLARTCTIALLDLKGDGGAGIIHIPIEQIVISIRFLA